MCVGGLESLYLRARRRRGLGDSNINPCEKRFIRFFVDNISKERNNAATRTPRPALEGSKREAGRLCSVTMRSSARFLNSIPVRMKHKIEEYCLPFSSSWLRASTDGRSPRFSQVELYTSRKEFRASPTGFFRIISDVDRFITVSGRKITAPGSGDHKIRKYHD
jgi:hypothetical protein